MHVHGMGVSEKNGHFLHGGQNQIDGVAKRDSDDVGAGTWSGLEAVAWDDRLGEVIFVDSSWLDTGHKGGSVDSWGEALSFSGHVPESNIQEDFL